jgi:hypothetical protein
MSSVGGNLARISGDNPGETSGSFGSALDYWTIEIIGARAYLGHRSMGSRTSATSHCPFETRIERLFDEVSLSLFTHVSRQGYGAVGNVNRAVGIDGGPVGSANGMFMRAARRRLLRCASIWWFSQHKEGVMPKGR